MSEMSELIAMGGYQTAPITSIEKVQTYDCDGPASINNNFTQQGSIGFAGTVLMASTWNTDTVYKFGPPSAAWRTIWTCPAGTPPP